MSFPQAPGYGAPPQQHGRNYQSAEGYGLAVASLACSALILPSAFVTMYPAMLAMLFTRPDTGSNAKEWVANVVFYSLPALFTLFSLTFGSVAVRRSVRGTSVRRLCIAGFTVAAVAAAILVWPLFVGEFDAFA